MKRKQVYFSNIYGLIFMLKNDISYVHNNTKVGIPTIFFSKT